MPNNELILYGTVGMSFWGEDYFTTREVREQLAGMSGDITVRINSGGGIATDGQAIYTMLVDYPGKVTVIVDGVAASAASLIAMAGDTIRMRLGGWMLIHDPAQWMVEGRGTEQDHLNTARLLGVIGEAYAEIYAKRTGMTREEARTVMRGETVLDGETAVSMGFADERDGEDAVAAARFDYRIYANAPPALRAASESRGPVPGMEAVLAMVTGHLPGKPSKEAAMPEDRKPAAGQTPAAVTTPTAAAPSPAPVQTNAPASAPAPQADANALTVAQANRLHQLGARAGMDATAVAAVIDRGVGFEAALDEITANWQAAAPDALPRAGAPTTRILRDERETRATAMSEALVAQMARRDPAHEAARAFMTASIIDMAATAIGHRGPLRSAGDRLDLLQTAFHSTSDFPAIFENALNKRLMDGYALAQPIYPMISVRMDFTDFRGHPMVTTGEFPTLDEVKENGEIQFGTFGEKKETGYLKAYAKGMRITRQMMINDDLSAIDRIIRSQGMSVARTEEAVFFAMMLGGANANGPTLNETGRQVFNATDATKAGTAAAITVGSIGVGRAAIRKHKSVDGADLDLTPSIILTGPDKQTEAEQLVATITANDTVKVNPFSGRLSPMSTAKIAGNAWYLLPDPNIQPLFMHGFLQGDAGPRMRMEEPFGTQGIGYTVERDFGVAAIDWRGGWKNAGA